MAGRWLAVGWPDAWTLIGADPARRNGVVGDQRPGEGRALRKALVKARASAWTTAGRQPSSAVVSAPEGRNIVRIESLEWNESQREAHVWFTDDGRLVTAQDWVDDASHLCALRELETMFGGRRTATIVIVNGEEGDAEMRKIWADGTVDLVVVEEFAGLFGPPREGARTELLGELVVEATPQTWWVTDARNDVTTVAVDWSDAVRRM